MRNLSFIVLSIIILWSCTSDNNSSGISGEIKNYDPSTGVKQVYLYALSSTNGLPSDTAFVQENGVFNFNINNKSAGIYTVGLAPQNAITVYIDSNKSDQKITINDYKKWSRKYQTEGNIITNEITQFVQEVTTMMEKGNDFNKQMATLGYNDTLELEKLRNDYEGHVNDFKKLRDDYINRNLETPAIIAVMDQIDPRSEMDLLKKVINNGVAKAFPNSEFLKRAEDFIVQVEYQIQIEGEMRKIEEQKKAGTFLQPGTPAPDLNFPSTNGNNIALSSLKGKVVLLDFWASWCRPCRAENPNVVKLYNQYHDKGFEVYSFSLDENKQKWVQAIQQDGLVWESHVSDLKGWNTAAIPIYGFNGIPFTVLIDREGNVIDKNLRGLKLEEKLQEIFK